MLKFILIYLIFCLYFLSAIAQTDSAYRIETDEKGRNVIIGAISWVDWQKEAKWESYSAEDFSPVEPIIKLLKETFEEKNISLKLFAGSWCGDTKTEMPKIIRIIESLEIDSLNFVIIGLDRNKREDTGLAESYNIERVPTLIVIREGMEIGRIVEFPKTAWDIDLAEIVFAKTDK